MKTSPDHWLDVSGRRVRYWQSGAAGTPVLLLHGIGCSALEWNHSLAPFGARHRVVAPDLLGFGASAKPADARYDLRSHAAFVIAIADRLGFERFHIAGSSLGGRIALQCAIDAPQRVASLLLVGPAGVGRETIINFRLASVRGLGELLTRPNRLGMRMLWRLAYANPARLEEERIDHKLHDAREPGAQAAFLHTLRGFVGFRGFLSEPLADLRRALPSIVQPTLIVWGRQDRLLPVAQAEPLRSALPDARLQVLDDCGHLPQLEQPEAFNPAALAFWAEVDSRERVALAA